MTAPNDCAYGRAATTRSIDRFIFDVATISIVRVILRVFSTDLMRPLSSRPLAMNLQIRLRDAGGLRGRYSFLIGLDAAAQISFDLLRQRLAGAKVLANLRVFRRHELMEAALPLANLRRGNVVDEAVGDGEDDHDLLLDLHRLILALLEHLH